MKRDMDLIRKILLEVESCQQGYMHDEIKFDGYDDVLVAYHCHLIGEAGLAHTVSTTTLHDKSPQANITGLS
jgi:hypothetical protein